ncbi:MAG: hypothetical protein ACD_5C00218G0001, partial [uncultured bacterium]
WRKASCFMGMNIAFPQSFRFGVGDSDLQVIGEDNTRKYEDSLPTMWNYFAKNSGKCFKNQTPGAGIDRYHYWKDDLALMQELGINDYRTSISISRTLKENGDINPKAINWYKNYFKHAKSLNIRVLATLYHWELPQYLSASGGWTNKKTLEIYLKHVNAVVNELGEYIEEYFIMNEPRCSSLVAHYLGAHAPGETNLKKALLVAHNILLAQGLAEKEIHSIDKNIKLSTAINAGKRYPATDKPEDIMAAKIVDGHKNLWFLDPIFLGKYPALMMEIYEKWLPKISQEDMKIIRIGNKLNSLGVNYYRGDIVKYDSSNELKFKTLLNEKGETTDLGWGIFVPPHYSEGLYDILSQIYSSYKNHGLKKIYITENGMALNSNQDEGKIIDDVRRIEFMSKHLYQIKKAIQEGIPIEAYFHWTLMDNYEWAEGYRPEGSFGLVNVNRQTMKRTPKKSFYWYKNVIRNSSFTL